MSHKSVWILGGGFIGMPLAIALKNSGHSVHVVLKTTHRVTELAKDDVKTRISNIGIDEPIKFDASPDVLIIAYPIKSSSANTENLLAQVQWISESFSVEKIEHVILTSSTSIYPDGFGLIDESFSNFNQPTFQFYYEQQIKKIYGEKLTTFRLAGLVGSERQPGRFLAGRENLPNAKSPVNLVHQGDVIRFICAAFNDERRGETFNLCHDLHPTREIYYTQTALALGLEPPKFNDFQILNPKIISNQKAKSFFEMNYEFGIEF